ncbi:O-antigen ligase family protein [Polaromonas jejuensis]|uniref:O-antigen ligase family protein n=2 Tax=Polaromonas jejuensis TaxID=457502 RepID=A0ABW0QEW7_9BURK|nr:O-antigen ligase family protein [Polaromonas jejuensis]
MALTHQVPRATILLKKNINFRLAIICIAAASVGLSMAIISIAKFLLLICGLATLLFARRTSDGYKPLAGACTPTAVLLVISAFTISLFWSVAPQADALGSIAKYGKLISILLMMTLIRDQREAMYALGAFALAQVVLVTSSWALFAHLPVPWASSNMAITQYAVFSSYLDQGIISAVFAAICWHLRFLAPGRYGKHLAVFAALLSIGNVFFVLNGRSGHVVAIALLSIAIMWELPKRYRAVVVLLPFLLALVLFFSSAKVRDRLSMVKSEVQSYSTQKESTTSSGIRLNLWRRAIQTIAQHPLAGSGVGSWSTEYNRLEREQNPAHVDIQGNGNPHQEYLLWGVQLGIPGILIFLALLLSILRDTMRMETPHARAAQSALLALAVACLFNASIYDAQIGDFFCVLIGLLLALGFSKAAHQATFMPQHEQAT